MVLIQCEGGSGLSLYTEEEKIRTMEEPGWTLSEEVIQERLQVIEEAWLTSDERLHLINNRLAFVIERYSLVQFDEYYMKEIADTMIQVRQKFDALRSSNMDLEQETIASYDLPAKGRNDHLTLIVSFMSEYVNALSPKYRATEVALIAKLPAILNKEFGNYTGIQDIPRLFIEGATKPITFAIGAGTKLATDILKESTKAMLDSLGLDSELLNKLPIYLIIIVVIIIVILILYVFLKSYITTKGRKIAEK